MELWLNAVWLLLAFAGIGFCVQHQFASRRSWRAVAPALLATAILFVLLFPIVSATDDLYDMQAVVEEPASRRAVSVTHGGSLAGVSSHSPLFVFLVPLLLIAPTFTSFGRTLDSSLCLVMELAAERHNGRAPPGSLRWLRSLF